MRRQPTRQLERLPTDVTLVRSHVAVYTVVVRQLARPSEQLVADITAVLWRTLSLFSVRVNKSVCRQGVTLCELFTADVTLVQCFHGVYTAMTSQVSQPSKRLAADLTAVLFFALSGLLAHVDTLVCQQGTAMSESLSTCVTCVRFLAGVYAVVGGQFNHLHERLAADVTAV